MEKTNLNPYIEMGKLHDGGLSQIITNYKGQGPEELNSVICAYISKIFDYPSEPSKLDAMELSSIFTIAQNAYINNEYPEVSTGQAPFISSLINVLKVTPPLDIPQFLDNIEDEITKTELSINEKMPLFFATSIGKANFNYWLSEIGNDESKWKIYFNGNYAVDLANVPYWVSAAIQATIYYCFKGSYFTKEDQPPKMAGPDIVTALTASLAVGAGKVIFQWVQKIKICHLCPTDLNLSHLNAENLKEPPQVNNKMMMWHAANRPYKPNAQCWAAYERAGKPGYEAEQQIHTRYEYPYDWWYLY